MQPVIDAIMRMTGFMHIVLVKIPVLGVPVARAYSGILAAFAWLGGVRRTESLEETKQHLVWSAELLGFPFEFSEMQSNQFVLELPHCPYGFNSPDHERACDTAMEMDRVMLRRCGAELIITDTIPLGAARCRMIVRQPNKADK